MKVEVANIRMPNVGDLQAKLDEAVGTALHEHAYDVLTTANQSIQRGSKTGRIYRRGKVSHQASAPSEPPASDTGRLVASGYVQAPEVIGKIVQAAVIWTVKYAVWLEKGTRKMAARPFARPAVLRLEETGRQRVQEAIAEALKK